MLAEVVRPAWRRWLTARARQVGAPPLPVWSLDESLTLACEDAARRSDADGEPRLTPDLVGDLRQAAAASLPPAGAGPALLMTTVRARRAAQRALGEPWDHVVVLGPDDLDAALPLEPCGTLRAP